MFGHVLDFDPKFQMTEENVVCFFCLDTRMSARCKLHREQVILT